MNVDLIVENLDFDFLSLLLQVHFYPFSPQFTDPHLYKWNLTGDNLLYPVPGVIMPTRPAQCSDYLAIRSHLHLLASTGASHYSFALNWSLILPQGDRSYVNTEGLRYKYTIMDCFYVHFFLTS